MPLAPVRFPSQRSLAPSVASVTSVILGVVHKFPSICLTAELNLRKPQLENEGAVRPVIASNGVSFLQMRSVGSHSTSGRDKEGNKEGTGGLIHKQPSH